MYWSAQKCIFHALYYGKFAQKVNWSGIFATKWDKKIQKTERIATNCLSKFFCSKNTPTANWSADIAEVLISFNWFANWSDQICIYNALLWQIFWEISTSINLKRTSSVLKRSKMYISCTILWEIRTRSGIFATK